MEWLQVRNWGRFQHYKDRNPPWIKMYTALLDDFEFAALDDGTKLALLMIWFLAARQNNRLRNDPTWIQHRAGLRTPPDLSALLAGRWLEEYRDPASKSASIRLLASEKERGEKKEKKETAGASLERQPPNPEDTPEDPRVTAARERLNAERIQDILIRQQNGTWPLRSI